MEYEKIYFVHSLNLDGGTTKYINDMVKTYQNTHIIWKKSDLNLINQKDIIWLNHFIKTEISIDDIIDIMIRIKCKLLITVHDMIWLCKDLYDKKDLKELNDNIHNIYLEESKIKIDENVAILFSMAKKVIFPSKFIYDIYSKYIYNENFQIINHNDFHIKKNINLVIPKIIDKNINIWHCSFFTKYKGSFLVNKLRKKYGVFRDYKINFFLTGHNIPKYDDSIEEFRKIINKFNIHCLLYLNEYGETWSYSLTKGIISGIPIFYNNIGSYKERIGKNDDRYVMCYESEKEIKSDIFNDKLYLRFENMLEYIIKKKSNEDEKIKDEIEKQNDKHINFNEEYEKFMKLKIKKYTLN